MNTFDDNDINSFTRYIFSSDPLSRFQHEKIRGVQSGSADDQALRALMLAVLEDGIACIQNYFLNPSQSSERLFCEAEKWINSNDDGVFSFNNICETLGLHPGRLRKGLEQWKAKQTRIPWEQRKRLILNKGKCLRKKTQFKARRAVYGYPRVSMRK